MTRARKAINLAVGRFAAVWPFAQAGNMFSLASGITAFAEMQNLTKLLYVLSSFASQNVPAASDK